MEEIHLNLNIPQLPPAIPQPTEAPPRLSYSMGISLMGDLSPKKEIIPNFKGKLGFLRGLKVKVASKFSKRLLKVEKFIINPQDFASSRNFDKLLRRLKLVDPTKVKHLVIQNLEHRFLIQLWKEIELRIREWNQLESLKFLCTLLEK